MQVFLSIRILVTSLRIAFLDEKRAIVACGLPAVESPLVSLDAGNRCSCINEHHYLSSTYNYTLLRGSIVK